MILYIENPKGSTKHLLELINEYSKVIGHKICVQKLILFLGISNEQSKNEIKRTIPLIIAAKNENRNKFNKRKEKMIYE